MIQAAKDGEFEKVFELLDKYPPYVNERPEAPTFLCRKRRSTQLDKENRRPSFRTDILEIKQHVFAATVVVAVVVIVPTPPCSFPTSLDQVFVGSEWCSTLQRPLRMETNVFISGIRIQVYNHNHTSYILVCPKALRISALPLLQGEVFVCLVTLNLPEHDAT
eukprot:4210331-Amphidinium_carterae.2